MTATVLVICNPGSVPRLRLQDAAMADRLRELPYAAVPTPDPAFKERMQTEQFRRAFLARLVAAAAAETPRTPPDAPPLVMSATAERIREDVGELGSFTRRIVRGAGRLTVAEAWEAWCEHHDEPPTATDAGGIGKRKLSGALRDHVPGLPAPKQTSLGGKVARGWMGWRLAAPEAAQPTPAVPRPTFYDTRYRLGDETVTGAELLRRLREKGSAWRLRVDGGEATIEPLHQDRETLPLPGMNGGEDVPEIW